MALSVLLSGLKVPCPLVVHIPPVAPVIFPSKPISALLPQTDLSEPALAVGAVVNVIFKLLDTGAQLTFLVEVSVKVMLDSVLSVALGSYLASKASLLGTKLPPPLDVHSPVLLSPTTEPVSVILVTLAHTD